MKKPSTPEPAVNAPTERLLIRLSTAELRAVDLWWRARPEVPNRTAGIRLLIDAGLAATGAPLDHQAAAAPKARPRGGRA
jgi:hypothetical protein